ncbi:MAG: hypothetical protein ABIF40_00500 [archaeon]
MGMFDFLRKKKRKPVYTLIEGLAYDYAWNDWFFKAVDVQINDFSSSLKSGNETFRLYGITDNWESIEKYNGISIPQPVPNFKTCDGVIRSSMKDLCMDTFEFIPRTVYTRDGRIFVHENYWQDEHFLTIYNQLCLPEGLFADTPLEEAHYKMHNV